MYSKCVFFFSFSFSFRHAINHWHVTDSANATSFDFSLKSMTGLRLQSSSFVFCKALRMTSDSDEFNLSESFCQQSRNCDSDENHSHSRLFDLPYHLRSTRRLQQAVFVHLSLILLLFSPDAGR